MQKNNVQWLVDRIKEEDEKLKPILGECSIGRLPIRAFLLECYLESMKAEPAFDKDIYNAVKKIVGFRMFTAVAGKGDDRGQIERQLEVAAMMEEMRRK